MPTLYYSPMKCFTKGYRTGREECGFTLVELAMVLMVVGLLLGGLFKGQQLLLSARVHNMVAGARAMEAAYNAFFDRYHYIPGDMPDAVAVRLGAAAQTGSQYGGDGNGRLGDGNFREASALWHQLASAGFILGSYSAGATDAASYVASGVAPDNPFGGRMMIALLDEYLSVDGNSVARVALVFGHGLPAAAARMLDEKLDDGRPATGRVRASSNGGVGANNYGGLAQSRQQCVSGSGTAAEWVAPDLADDCNLIMIL
ncbi:MAG: prepilin-type N-terminal cleavage/methylation domain-containing protein [Candidatus Porifericomitaceae bacterium WSBS_2022_MAG_OTU9]